MIIGILSDTHSLNLPEAMLKAFKKADLIIHAGDICDGDVLRSLEAIAPVKAVQGNMDDGSLKKKLPLKLLIDADSVKIGVAHGHGSLRDALSNVKDQFKDEKVDVVIFGHSHKPYNEKTEGVLYFNPGSPNDVIRAPYFSYGLIEIDNGKIKASIVKI